MLISLPLLAQQNNFGGGGGNATPCTTTAGAIQYNNAGSLGCVSDFTFSGHTITGGASGIFDLSALGAGNVKMPSGFLTSGYADFTEIAAPANPAAGVDRLYYDSTAHALKCIQSSGASCNTASVAWSGITNAAGALSLSNAGNATTFNQTSAVNWTWANTTSAIHLTPQNSPIFNLSGAYFNGSVSSTDSWTIQDVLGSADNGTSTLTFAHSGSSGTASVQAPGFATSGNNGGIWGTEGTGANATTGAGTDTLYPDSTNHCFHANFNNSDVGCVATASNTLTLTNKSTSAGAVVGTVASGTATMGTGAITSGTCATVVTVSATGTATTDVIQATPNTDPTAVTGYAPAAGGSLYIQAYPTANNVNFKVCNNTSGSITPAALTLNWRVAR